MRAIKVAGDLTMQWVDVPEPVPGPAEVLVDIHATAVNRADLLQRIGKYPPPSGAPEWMGLEMAGVISRVGSVSAGSGPPEGIAVPRGREWKPGDRVCALLAGGGYAERVAVARDLLLPVPDGLAMTEAASLPEVFATAYLNLFLEADLRRGETVLVQAGASGVGIAATQMAHRFGSRVLTTVGSATKAEAIRSFGADVVVDRTTTDLGEVLVRAEAEGRPVDVVLDCVGGTDLGPHLSRIARGGRWVVIATLAGPRTEIDLRTLLVRGQKLLGSTLRNRPMETKARIIRELADRVWPEIETGRIRPVVHRVYPIEEVAEAHAVLERRENVGKVVLTIRDESSGLDPD